MSQSKTIYLDSAATSQVSPEVVEAMMPYLSNHYGNPSSIHHLGRITKTAIERARKVMADGLNASPAEIFFTSCGTESNNTVLRRAVVDLGVTHFVSSPIEHHCVTHTLDALLEDFDIKVTLLNVGKDGNVDLDQLEQVLSTSEDKILVSLMHANNEIGNLLELKRVGELCEIHEAYFHSDSVQSVGHYPIDLQETKVHFITGSAHKIHGPKGSGFFYMRGDANIKPFIYGGSQERNMRAGTENVAGIIGLARAFEHCLENMEADAAHILSLKNYMRDRLKEQFPSLIFNGEQDDNKSLYTVLNVGFPEHDKNALLLFNLDIAGVCCSTGSACSSGSEARSHVLEAINADPTMTAIRFSFSKYNTTDEIDTVMEELVKIFEMQTVA